VAPITSEADTPVEQAKALPYSEQYTRCTIESVTDDFESRPERKLTISGDKFDGIRTLVLEDDWIELPAVVGDTINVLGSYDFDLCDEMRVSRKHGGLIILHPDILVSSTKAADSSHCTRKAVLQELIRTVGDTTPSLIYGNMLHSLMQACMLENRWDDAFRQDKIAEIVKQSGGQLFAVNLEFEKAREELDERSKDLEAFADRYVGEEPKFDAFLSDPQAKDADRCRLAITKSVAEEEDVWSPRTGLKGKIDVTTLTRLADPRQPGTERTTPTPFEIKTGRTNAGMEHRAQTMLYTLLLEDRYGQSVDTGLLMYTQSNDVFAVKRGENELRGLIMARNRFASFLNSRLSLSDRGERIEPSQAVSTTSDVDRALLPPPVDEIRACKRCYVGNACRVFRRSAGGAEDVPADEELRALYDSATGHLTDEEASFFARWERLISFEEQELARFKKEIWTLQAEERESLGRCLADMVIDEEQLGPTADVSEERKSVPVAAIHRWTYRMRRNPKASTDVADLLGTSISVGDPIVVSLEIPRVLAVARGFVQSVSLYHVEIGLDRRITDLPQLERNPKESPVFRIDKDELSAAMGRIRDNLLQLFYADADERRRKLIVGLKAPQFDPKLAQDAHRVTPSHLNEDQRNAIERVLAAQDYALILGMPGTGKTTTTAEIIRALARTGKSILLTSYTHSAVDNILLKLAEGNTPSILRLGNSDKILPSLRRFTLSPSDYATSLEDIEARLMKPQIVATTCLGINESAALGGGLDISLFKRLSEAHPDAVVNLSCQYRMNSDIMSLSNKLVYSDRLKVGSEAVGTQQLALPDPDALRDAPLWVQEILDPKRSVVFVDTDALPARERRDQSLIDNASETALVKELVAGLVNARVAEEDIAVITPYRQQVKLVVHELSGLSGVEVLTADRSQGRDKECIIISLVRSNSTKNAGDLLKDRRRINVCLTRAKSKLIIVGSHSTVASAPVMQELLDFMRDRDWIYQL
ncbi:Dna2-domain-containing protein, partial [Rhodotorula sp. JG-1b]